MKKFFALLMMTSFLATFGFASSDLGQQNTDCEMMKESNDRSVVNKGTVTVVKPQTKRPTSSTRL